MNEQHTPPNHHSDYPGFNGVHVPIGALSMIFGCKGDVGANGRFSIAVPVGQYKATGQSPQYEGGAADCHASGPVVVTKGGKSTVEVDCRGQARHCRQVTICPQTRPPW